MYKLIRGPGETESRLLKNDNFHIFMGRIGVYNAKTCTLNSLNLSQTMEYHVLLMQIANAIHMRWGYH